MRSTKYLFFSGKGGVGKTTMACATAVHYAKSGKKTLIVTTDPASNLADVFEAEIGHKITPLGIPDLWGMEIDPDKATEEYREKILSPMRRVMPPSVMKVLEEQFASPCTTEIAAFDRFVDFMAGGLSEEGAGYDIIIFDTAPTGHTIRLLELPVNWSKHIEESAKGTGNTCIGPVAAIQENKAKYDAATRLLGDASRTTFYFVLQPEKTSLYETKRSSAELGTIGIKNIELIVNGILPEEVCEHPFFASRNAMQKKYLERIAAEFPMKTRRMFQRDGEIKGFGPLRMVANDLFSPDEAIRTYSTGISANGPSNPKEYARIDSSSILELIKPVHGHTKAVYFTGKGGVGKTVVSCAAAYALAYRGYKTLLLTTDPASHIGQVLEREIGDSIAPMAGIENLYAVSIDQKKAAEEYKARIIADAEKRYGPDMLLAVREELESPCTEEMAAFDKFMGYVENDDFDVVVFDTAPTGHTLRLIELPFDYSDQVGMMVTTNALGTAAKTDTKKRFERVISLMKDPNRSIFAFVIYPEATPVIEAYRAFLDLRKAGIHAQFVVANQVLTPEYCTNGYFKNRRAMQERYLAEIGDRFNLPVSVLPLLENEIQGLGMITRAAEALCEENVPVARQ